MTLPLTEFNGHCHSSSILLPPVPSLPFGRGLGAQPPMPVSLRLRQPSLPSHAPTLPPGPSGAVGSHRRVVKTRLMGRSPCLSRQRQGGPAKGVTGLIAR